MPNTWFLMQEFNKATYFNWAMQMRNASLGWKDEFGIAGSLTVQHDNVIELHFHQQQWRMIGEMVWNKVKVNPQWLDDITTETYKRIDNFFVFLNKLKAQNLMVASNGQLSDLLTEFEQHRYEIHIYGVVGTILEFDHELLSKYLQNYLQAQVEKIGSILLVNQAFSTLTTFHKDTFVRKEEKSMLKLVEYAQSTVGLLRFILEQPDKNILEILSKEYSDFNKKFEEHYENFCWIQYQHVGPAWSREYFVDILRSLLKQGINPINQIKDFTVTIDNTQKEQEKISKELEFDDYHKNMFRLARELSFVKSLRNDSFFCGFYIIEPLLKEIGKRLGLSLSQVRVCLPGEIQQALSTGNYSVDDLNNRLAYSVYAILEGKISILTGQAAKDLVNKIKALEPKIEQSNEIKGTVAVPGKVKGMVKVVNEVEDIHKMKDGDVLVSNATYPSLVSAMRKAIAIITDLGGITSHAAIISRELKIPCVVGTKIATKVLKDGDIVEVDADNGIVRKI
ncbi:MAG: PEP-utilizing enzyme [bacterium]